MNNKSDLRKHAKLIRRSLDMKSVSENLIEKILSEDFFTSAKNIMIFYPLEHEIDLTPLLKVQNKNFYLPKIKGENLEACPYKLNDKLADGLFKTKEPLSSPVNPEILDLIFVPALIVDKNNYRLGYGKGYYDRFLNNLNAKTVVLIPKDLIVENLPTESHDKKIDIVISN